jgi:hypothetical protein
MSDDTTASSAAGRREQFEEDIAAVRIRTGKGEAEQRFVALGVAGMVIGAVICLGAYFASKGMSDSRDISSVLILALFGLALTFASAAVFIRYSFARFLRFWLLRLIYEQQNAE